MTIRKAITAILLLAGCLTPGRAEENLSERSEREKGFILGVLRYAEPTEEDSDIDEGEAADIWEGVNADIPLAELEPYAGGVMRLPGDSFRYPFVNSDRYLNGHGFLYDPSYPLESLANLLVVPLDEGEDVTLDLTVVTHDYRSKATLATTVCNLVRYCLAEGCEPFVGFERYAGGGEAAVSLFMVNEDEGYLHLLRLECDPVAVIGGNTPIRGRVSLFIPNDNIADLFQDMPQGKSKAMQQFENLPIAD